MAVDLFFIIAGFNISYAFARKNITNFSWGEFNWKTWIKARIFRLYPSFFYAVLFIYITYAIFQYQYPEWSFDFLLSLLGWAGLKFQVINPGLWFFTVILEAYLITPIFYSLFKGNHRWIAVSMILVAIATKIACLATLSGSEDWYFFLVSNNFIGSYIGQFGLGLFWGHSYWHNGNRFKPRDFYGSLLIFVAALVIYIALSASGQDFRYMIGFDLAFTPLTFLGLYFLFSRSEVWSKANALLTLTLQGLSTLGKYSYQIFLIHQPLFFVILPILTGLIALGTIPELASVLVITLILLTLYVLLFLQLEKTMAPITRRLLKS